MIIFDKFSICPVIQIKKWVFFIKIIMNIIKFKRLSIWNIFKESKRYHFSKSGNDNNKYQQQKNENYANSKIPVNKVNLKEEKIKEIKQLSFNNRQDLRFLLMGNVLLMGGIPFWAPLNIGICLLNGGFILSRIGQQTKKYLLLLNNNQLEQLNSFRPLNQYLKIILSNMIILGFQCLILATNSFQLSSLLSMTWMGIAIKQNVLPTYFYLTLIPLFISVFVNIFSETIKSVLLGQQPIQETILQSSVQ